ncbi:hypothetical protein AXG93_2675s1300 [Marchantia polymorpha subsp. ruderalis]|uniref:Uncharacterized protein n=2 Tax=Marchantia polymorpha subsp. ruderalis TaxID=1480154 RepID=A0A176VS57_MARPO|nr:hypothetical protein AXG93_2675s1300 [Marchantia polymorpha subsp. ruderalis]
MERMRFILWSFEISRDIPSPLPAPKVADKTRVPEAFGLQKSRSGRLLVPRLATWRNQSIKYDMDGGIIAISEGFEEAEGESCTGCYNFKTPSHGDARVMQRKFLVAADMAADLVRM